MQTGVPDAAAGTVEVVATTIVLPSILVALVVFGVLIGGIVVLALSWGALSRARFEDTVWGIQQDAGTAPGLSSTIDDELIAACMTARQQSRALIAREWVAMAGSGALAIQPERPDGDGWRELERAVGRHVLVGTVSGWLLAGCIAIRTLASGRDWARCVRDIVKPLALVDAVAWADARSAERDAVAHVRSVGSTSE